MEFSQPRPAIAIMGFFFFGCDVLLMAIEGVFRGLGRAKFRAGAIANLQNLRLIKVNVDVEHVVGSASGQPKLPHLMQGWVLAPRLELP